MLLARQIAVGVAPPFVRVDAVGAGGQDGAVAIRELAERLVEGDDLRRADEREIERIEVQADPFALVVGELRSRFRLGGSLALREKYNYLCIEFPNTLS